MLGWLDFLQEMYSEVPVPKSLEVGKSFDFLRRDLRRTGLLSSPGGGAGGFDSSLHGGGMGGSGGYSSSGLSNSSLHGGSSGHIGGG